MSMSTQQATDQAAKLKKQGLTYQKIADHLKAAGYISPRTGQPVKQMAVRYMVTNAELKEKKEIREELEDEKIFVVSNERSFKENIQILLKVKDFSSEMKLRLIEALTKEDASPVRQQPRVNPKQEQVSA